MDPQAVPDWLAPLLRLEGAPLRAAAKAALPACGPWNEARRGLTRILRLDPGRALPVFVALRSAAEAAGDRAAAASLLFYEAQAVHRTGRLDEALDLYARADRDLRRAGLVEESRGVGVARVDALATAGRIDAALRLADRLAKGAKGKRSTLDASLAVNRANALRLRGDLDEAVAMYESAAKDLEELGNRPSAAVARLNAGVALLEAGEVEAAHARLSAALDEFRALGVTDLEREARYDLAWAEAHAGRLGAAIRALAALAEEHRASSLPRREALCRMDLADALRRAGDLPSAEREAVRAAQIFEGAGAGAERADAFWFAAAAAAPVDADRASRHAREARRAAARAGRAAVRLRCDVLLADLGTRRGRPASAAALTDLAKRARTLGATTVAADVDLLAGEAALASGWSSRARERFERVRRTSLGRPWARLAAETGLARADASDPRRRGLALRRLRRVASFLDEVRSGLPGAWLRTTFLAERLDPYLARVDLLLSGGSTAERREAAALLDALAARRFLAARPPTTDARLARARARLEAIYDRLARGDVPSRAADGPAPTTALLGRRARRWERAVAEAWRKRERGSAPSPGEDTAAPILAPLPDGVGLLHLWRRGTRAVGLLRVGDDIAPAVDLGPAADLSDCVESLRLRARRWAMVRGSAPAAADARATEVVLATLASRVLTPLGEPGWPVEVRVVADPSLPDLPWELLPVAEGRLGEMRRILRVPAGSVRPVQRPSGRGITVVSIDEPNLPGAALEARAIAASPGATRLSGADATRAAVGHALATAEVVHLAGHGWEATEAPPLAGVRLADGWFGAADVPPVGVAADLVLLAACRAGGAPGEAGVAWGGLVTALLAGGARYVLWTTDDVDDEAAARLTTRFHGLRSSVDTVPGFGQALAEVAAEMGHPGAVLAFRLTGVPE